MGSRYGGLKQLDPVGPSGETMLDYAVHDALRELRVREPELDALLGEARAMAAPVAGEVLAQAPRPSAIRGVVGDRQDALRACDAREQARADENGKGALQGPTGLHLHWGDFA